MTDTTTHTQEVAPGATVAVTGATGFVGRHITRALVDAGYTVRPLVRQRDKAARFLPKGGVDPVEGDVLKSATLAEFVAGVDAVIHLVGIIEERPGKGVTFRKLHVEATRNVVEATQYAGVRRYLHMSALGARAAAISAYHRTKYEAEQIVHTSSLAWTIFQPSLILGPDGEFAQMMQAWARGKEPPFLLLPYFGAGLLGFGRRAQVQPIAVADVAACFVEALRRPASIEKTYALGGPERLTWPQMLTRVRERTPGAASWRKPLPLPAWFAGLIAGGAESLRLGSLLPFNSAQVQMSQEDSVADMDPARADLGVEPRPLEAALAGEERGA
jgi:NADH dehydrogenase